MAVLILGGTKGVGKAIALEFAESGTELFLVYGSDDAAAQSAVAACEANGASTRALRMDIGERENCTAVVEGFAQTGWQLDHIVHSAVVAVKAPLDRVDSAVFERAFAVAASSLLYVVQAALPLLRSGSSITYISSGSAKIGSPGIAPIGVPKAAAEALIRYMAVEFGPDGIRANCVVPGMLITESLETLFPGEASDMRSRVASATPSPRPVTFEDVARVVRFVASPAGEMINGREIVVDGGYSIKRIRP